MDLYHVTQLLWDGSIRKIQRFGRTVILTISGAQVAPDRVNDLNILSTSGCLFGRLHLEEISSPMFLDIVSQIERGDYFGNVYELRWDGKTIQFQVMWEPLSLKTEERIPMFCQVEAENIYWENLPASDAGVGPPITCNTALLEKGTVIAIRDDIIHNSIEIWMKSLPIEKSRVAKGFITANNHSIEGYLHLMWVLDFTRNGVDICRPVKMGGNKGSIRTFSIHGHQLTLEVVWNHDKTDKYEALIGGITWVDSHYVALKSDKNSE